MKSTVGESPNPLGLNLDFMFGRGYLWAKREKLSDWITLESLRMEIPDLSFPFDARGGLDRFRNTRCLARQIEIGISEVGLGDLLRRATEDLERFEDLQVTFLEDAIHLSVKVSAFGSDTYVSFRAAPIPPEPPRADEIHLSMYDYRAFGPLPFPARLVAYELMTGLLNTPLLRPPGRGSSFTVGVAGDILRFRPLKLLLLHIFPAVGWKLPDLSDIALDGARVRPGGFTIRASARDDDYHGDEESEHELGATREGARALAAYESKNLFVDADEALFNGQIRQALELFAGYRDAYGLHSDLAARWLDCLIADPSPANVAEAEAICRELQEENPDDLHALLVRPTLALVADDDEEVIEAYDELARILRERGERPDWVLCQTAAAQRLADDHPEEAAERLREVLKVSPRNRVALEALRELYTRLGERSGLEEVLKRLTGVYTDRDTLKETYLELAHHLLDREGELAEARLYLEKVLRLDPAQLEALDTLGESYALSDEPLRALKAFGSAARAAEADGQARRAAKLRFRVARLWFEELGDVGQALLSCRRALSMWESDQVDAPTREYVDVLEFAAKLCEERERLEEATDYWMQVIPLLEESLERASAQSATAPAPGAGEVAEDLEAELRSRLVAAHEALGKLYAQRNRADQAVPHFRRIIEVDP
ncbi:MAG: tetratricopeptide repeat protein, partial [Persicimonas sp.]